MEEKPLRSHDQSWWGWLMVILKQFQDDYLPVEQIRMVFDDN